MAETKYSAPPDPQLHRHSITEQWSRDLGIVAATSSRKHEPERKARGDDCRDPKARKFYWEKAFKCLTRTEIRQSQSLPEQPGVTPQLQQAHQVLQLRHRLEEMLLKSWQEKSVSKKGGGNPSRVSRRAEAQRVAPGSVCRMLSSASDSTAIRSVSGHGRIFDITRLQERFYNREAKEDGDSPRRGDSLTKKPLGRSLDVARAVVEKSRAKSARTVSTSVRNLDEKLAI